MIDGPRLAADFLSCAPELGLTLSVNSIEHELQRAPHRPHGLPTGKCAVYVFSLSRRAGSLCPAGPNRALKVGRVGPNSNARFLSQHYNPDSAGSNLARSLLRSPHHWTYLGIDSLDKESVGPWIKEHTDRDHFYVTAALQGILRDLEGFIRGRVGPVFEGY